MGSKIAILSGNKSDDSNELRLLDSLKKYSNGPNAEYFIIGWKELATGEIFDVLITIENKEESNILKRLGEFLPLNGPVVVLSSNPTELQKNSQESPVPFLALPIDESVPILAATLIGMLSREAEMSHLRGRSGLVTKIQDDITHKLGEINDELVAAGVLQRECLDLNDSSFAGVSIASVWKPLGHVSGDLLAIRKLNEDQILIALCDAIGHGLPAAMLTMVLDRTIRQKSEENQTPCSASSLLNAMNQALLTLPGETTKFATGMVGILDTKIGTLEISGAGHPSAMIKSSNGKVRIAKSHGPLLGIFENENYSSDVFDLAKDDTVFMLSDGIEEIFENKIIDSKDKIYHPIENVLKSYSDASQSIQEIKKFIKQNIESNHIQDDLTLLALTWEGTQSKLHAA
jgi:sigma-B regulation protein RsbU (phosphoserine phosphatase)